MRDFVVYIQRAVRDFAHQEETFHCPKDQGHLDPEENTMRSEGAEKTLEKGFWTGHRPPTIWLHVMVSKHMDKVHFAATLGSRGPTSF